MRQALLISVPWVAGSHNVMSRYFRVQPQFSGQIASCVVALVSGCCSPWLGSQTVTSPHCRPSCPFQVAMRRGERCLRCWSHPPPQRPCLRLPRSRLVQGAHLWRPRVVSTRWFGGGLGTSRPSAFRSSLQRSVVGAVVGVGARRRLLALHCLLPLVATRGICKSSGTWGQRQPTLCHKVRSASHSRHDSKNRSPMTCCCGEREFLLETLALANRGL